MNIAVLGSIDDIISNVCVKLPNEISGRKVLEEDVPMMNGELTADCNDVIENEKKSTDEAPDSENVAVRDSNDASAEENAENVDVAEIIDFISNISDKVHKAMEVEDSEMVERGSNEVSNEALTNGFESIKQQDFVQDNDPTAEVDKSPADNKIVLDDDNIEISDDGNPSEEDIVDITSDDEDRLLQSPTASTASEPIADPISAKASDALNISSDVEMKDEERKSPAVNDAIEKKTPKSSEISSIVIDVDDDDDDEAAEIPKAPSIAEIRTINLDDDDDADEEKEKSAGKDVENTEEIATAAKTIDVIVASVKEIRTVNLVCDDEEDGREKSDKIELENTDEIAIAAKAIDVCAASTKKISTINLVCDDEEEEKDKNEVENSNKIATAAKAIDECVAHDDNATEASEVSKSTDTDEPKEINSLDLLIIESKGCADSNDASVSKLPVAETATEKEKEIIAAIDQDIDQGNNLLEEMVDVPISNGGSSEGSSSANEDDDMDPNHFASDDIILLPYDDEVSKNSVCFDVTKEASSTSAPSDDAIGVDGDEKVEASCIETEKSLSEPVSIGSLESASIADEKPNEKVDENLEHESAHTTPVEASKENSSTDITILPLTLGDKATPDDEESLPSAIKTKLDLTDSDETQPEAKRPRVDSLFDLLKESEPSSADPSVAGTTATTELVDSASGMDDAADVIVLDVPSIDDAEQPVLIESSTKTTDVVPTGSKRPPQSDLCEEIDTKKLKISDETDKDGKVEPEGVADETATTGETTDTEAIVRAATPKIQLTPEPTKPEQKQTLALDFLNKFKKQFDQMTKTDLEDLVLEKIVEAIVHKSEYSDLRNKTNAQEQIIQSLRVKVQELCKQYRDLEMVHTRVVKDLETRNQNVISPVKITRAVGLQVCLTKKDAVALSVQPAPPVVRPTGASTSQQTSKEELARRAAMVLQQQKVQKMQRQAELNKQKMETQEDIIKKNRLAHQRAGEINKSVRLLHNQQLRMKAQQQQSQQNKMVHLLPKATSVTVAQTPQLRKSLPVQPPQIT